MCSAFEQTEGNFDRGSRMCVLFLMMLSSRSNVAPGIDIPYAMCTHVRQKGTHLIAWIEIGILTHAAAIFLTLLLLRHPPVPICWSLPSLGLVPALRMLLPSEDLRERQYK